MVEVHMVSSLPRLVEAGMGGETFAVREAAIAPDVIELFLLAWARVQPESHSPVNR